MTNIECNLCGKAVDISSEACPGCGTDIEILKLEVQIPDPIGVVNDFPGVLTDAQTGELSSLVTSFFHKSDVPIIIVIVNSCGNLSPAEYAFLLYNHWGIGHNKINRGVLILVCLKEKHIETEIGIGLEPVLSEEKGDYVVAQYVNYFRDGKYFEGLKKGTSALIEELNRVLPQLY